MHENTNQAIQVGNIVATATSPASTALKNSSSSSVSELERPVIPVITDFLRLLLTVDLSRIITSHQSRDSLALKYQIVAHGALPCFVADCSAQSLRAAL